MTPRSRRLRSTIAMCPCLARPHAAPRRVYLHRAIGSHDAAFNGKTKRNCPQTHTIALTHWSPCTRVLPSLTPTDRRLHAASGYAHRALCCRWRWKSTSPSAERTPGTASHSSAAPSLRTRLAAGMRLLPRPPTQHEAAGRRASGSLLCCELRGTLGTTFLNRRNRHRWVSN